MNVGLSRKPCIESCCAVPPAGLGLIKPTCLRFEVTLTDVTHCKLQSQGAYLTVWVQFGCFLQLWFWQIIHPWGPRPPPSLSFPLKTQPRACPGKQHINILVNRMVGLSPSNEEGSLTNGLCLCDVFCFGNCLNCLLTSILKLWSVFL